MVYEIYTPDTKEVIVGVHCIFKEIIPSFSDEYLTELKKLSLKLRRTRALGSHSNIW